MGVIGKVHGCNGKSITIMALGTFNQLISKYVESPGLLWFQFGTFQDTTDCVCVCVYNAHVVASAVSVYVFHTNSDLRLSWFTTGILDF